MITPNEPGAYIDSKGFEEVLHPWVRWEGLGYGFHLRVRPAAAAAPLKDQK